MDKKIIESNKRIEYLYNAIKETQDLIKFTESKIAFIIGLLSAYFALILLTAETIIKYYIEFSWLLLIIYFLTLISLVICVWITIRIIFPIKDPQHTIDIIADEFPKTKFYLAPNRYKTIFYPFVNSPRDRLTISFNNYLSQIKNMDEDELIKVLSFELMKISFIRNIKNDRLKWLVVFLVISSIGLIAVYILYHVELYRISISN